MITLIVITQRGRSLTKIFQFTLERHLAEQLCCSLSAILSSVESFLEAISYDVELFTKTHIPFIRGDFSHEASL